MEKLKVVPETEVVAKPQRRRFTAAHELDVKQSRYALATLCIGGGQGGAFVLERSAS